MNLSELKLSTNKEVEFYRYIFISMLREAYSKDLVNFTGFKSLFIQLGNLNLYDSSPAKFKSRDFDFEEEFLMKIHLIRAILIANYESLIEDRSNEILAYLQTNRYLNMSCFLENFKPMLNLLINNHLSIP
jgi:hypothetical protein